MKIEALITLIIKALPYSEGIEFLDVAGSSIRFRWRGQEFQVATDLLVTGPQAAPHRERILVEHLLKKTVVIDMLQEESRRKEETNSAGS